MTRMSEEYLEEFRQLPLFEDGRIDYTSAIKAPVVLCAVHYEDDVLLLKRSGDVGNYQSCWNLVAGFIDRDVCLEDHVTTEVTEELGLSASDIEEVLVREPYELPDADLGKTWLIYPSSVLLTHRPAITLDWESTEYRWVKPSDIGSYDTPPGLDETLKRALSN
jgi:8-oxo-dGTP diphosphatase